MTTAGADEHARIKSLFNSVCDLPDAQAQRQALKAQGVDGALLAELMNLLGHADAATHIAAPIAAAAGQWLGSELHPGDRLGAWTLKHTLGEGGMGRVFLAERSDGHYEQQVAIKLLLGWSGPDALARLTRERQILAHLNHPHIARLLDGGTTPGGQPYLVMEHAQGVAIDVFCSRHTLGLAQRLALFQMVCDAVAHAHRQLVVHCDIKPANVLVDDHGHAMLLDFGIARLEGQAEVAAAAMSPGYASPEQTAGLPPGTPSDIYSLGRLLAELMQPIASDHRRGTELAAVVARATASAPEARYGSVGALQRDLERLLAQQPLAAMPASRRYLLGKLLRRRWPWALGGLGALLLSTAFTLQLVRERDRAVAAEVLANAQRERAEAERRRAEIEVDTTTEVSRFLMSLFTGTNIHRAGKPDAPRALQLDKGRERLATEMQDKRAVRARMLVVLGDIYERLRKEKSSISAYGEAAELFASPGVDQPLAQADALRRQALVLASSGQPERAEAPARRALALRERFSPDNLYDIADSENRLGIVLTYLHRYDEARPRLEKAVRLRTQTGGADDPNTTSTLHNLARLNLFTGDAKTAEQQLRHILDTTQRTLEPLDRRRLQTMQTYGATLTALQRHAEAERVLRQAVAGWSTNFGADNGTVAVSLKQLGLALLEAGKLAPALEELQQALRIETAVDAGATHHEVEMHMGIARVHEAAGRLEEAAAGWRTAARRLGEIEDASPLAQAAVAHGLAHTLWLAGQLEQASTTLDQALALREARLPAGDADRLASETLRAEITSARR